jgi:hypothetical protein
VERGDRRLGRSGSGMWKASTLKAVAPPPPPVSVKDQWVGDMGPISLVACRRQMLGFAPTASRLARERNWVRTRGSVSPRAVDCVRSPFLGSSGPAQLCR